MAITRAVESLRYDLRQTVLKPLLAKWMIDAFAHVYSDPNIVRRGWESSGITPAVINLSDSICDNTCHAGSTAIFPALFVPSMPTTVLLVSMHILSSEQ